VAQKTPEQNLTQQPPTLNTVPQQPTVPPQNSTPQSNKESSANGWIAVFTGALFIAALLQYLAMRKQAEYMRRGLLINIRALRSVRHQGRTMQNQLAQMEAAGHQTDRLIEQTAKNADAALKSAQAIINSERAWVLVDLEWPRPIITHGIDKFTIYCDIMCVNEGKTIAWLTEKRIGLFKGKEPFPNSPPLHETQLVQAGIEPIAGKKLFHDAEASHPGMLEAHTAEDGNLVVIFGTVTYQDIHGESHATTFGYRLNVERTRLIRLLGYPEWNRND
jgi:hypothetical protein